MRVLITGGAGHIGKVTAERLIRRGWEVRLIGLETGVEIPGATFTTCDIMDYAALRQQVRGCDAVIHLAALRGPSLAPAPDLFRINVAGAFNVFEAAAAEGVRRVVQASSINALGAVWSTGDNAIEYLPVDEAHPTFTTDVYGFGKQVIEEIGSYYWRRDGISGVALRFPGVYGSDYLQSESYRTRRDRMRRMLDDLSALSETDRQARLAETRQGMLEFRKQRPFDYRADGMMPPPSSGADAPLAYTYTIDRFNLWAWIDVRDAAQSLEKGVSADYEGAHTLFVTDQQNYLGYDSMALVRFFYPGVPARLAGSLSLVSTDRARALIGFEPEHSVPTAPENRQTEQR